MEPDPSTAAKKRMLSLQGEPLLVADWDRAAFLHFEVDPEVLQPEVPYPLDLHRGKAYVSLVAFTMRRLRCVRLQRFAEWLMRPIGSHPYLNVRTYVRHAGEPGIYFLAEWMTNPVSLFLGGPLFGLPYRRGKATYLNEPFAGRACGEVRDHTGSRFEYSAVAESGSIHPAAPGSLDEFLVERYTCFTNWRSWRRFFRVWHPPWRIAPAIPRVTDSSLLVKSGRWFRDAKPAGAHLSPGCHDVWMGRPHCVPR
jgi:uncharacterized protein YqjF (DUF2071 family)